MRKSVTERAHKKGLHVYVAACGTKWYGKLLRKKGQVIGIDNFKVAEAECTTPKNCDHCRTLKRKLREYHRPEVESSSIFTQPVVEDKVEILSYTGSSFRMKTMNVKELIPTKTLLSTRILREMEKGLHVLTTPTGEKRKVGVDDRPRVAMYDFKTYILDGHYRLAVQILKGEEEVEVYVFKIAAPKKSKPVAAVKKSGRK